MSGYIYYLGGDDIYVQDENGGEGAFLYLENEATENTHAVNLSTLNTVAMDLQRQIQYFGGYPNAYWVTPASESDLSGNLTYKNEDGSVSRTFYTSISSAITAAAASTYSATYTAYIYIQPGTYSISSTISIPKNLTSTNNTDSFFNVKIIGEGEAGDVILDFGTTDNWSTGTTGFESDDNASYTVNSYIAFENLTIQNAYHGIYISGTEVCIKNCKFINCGWDGTDATDTSSTNWSDLNTDGYAIYVNGCNFDDTLTGVTTSSSISLIGTSVEISNCTFEGNNASIYVTRGTNVTIKNNVIKSAIETGIYLDQCHKGIVQNNNILSTYASGIHLESCFRCNILDNSIYNTWNAALCFTNSPHTLAQNNVMNFVNSRAFNGKGEITGDTTASIMITGAQDDYVRYWIIILGNESYSGPGRLTGVDGSEDNSGNFIQTNKLDSSSSMNGLNNSTACIFTNNTLNRGGGGAYNGSDNSTYVIRALDIDSNVDLAVIITNFNGIQPFYISNSTTTTFSNWNNYIYESEPTYAVLILKDDNSSCTLVINGCMSFGYNVASSTGEGTLNLLVQSSS